MMDVSRHRYVETLRGYVRDANYSVAMPGLGCCSTFRSGEVTPRYRPIPPAPPLLPMKERPHPALAQGKVQQMGDPAPFVIDVQTSALRMPSGQPANAATRNANGAL
jgi:hypothetical protein